MSTRVKGFIADLVRAGTVCPRAVDIDGRVAVSLAHSKTQLWRRGCTRKHGLEVKEHWQVREVTRQAGSVAVAIRAEEVAPGRSVVRVESPKAVAGKGSAAPEAVNLGLLAGGAAIRLEAAGGEGCCHNPVTSSQGRRCIEGTLKCSDAGARAP